MFVIFIENKESWNTSTTMAAVGVRVSKEKDKSGVRKKTNCKPTWDRKVDKDN